MIRRCRRARNSRGSHSEGDRDAGDGGRSKSVLRLRSAPVRILRGLLSVLLDSPLNSGARDSEDGFHAVAEPLEGFWAFDHLRLLHGLDHTPPMPRELSNRLARARRGFGSAVASLRKVRGLSQVEFAERARLSVNTLGRIERGEVSPTLDTMLDIALTLDFALADLVAGLDAPPFDAEE